MNTNKNKYLKLVVLGGILFMSGSLLYAGQSKHSSEQYGYYLKAIVEQTQGNLALAEDYFQKAIDLSPDSAYLHQAVAEMTLRQNQYEKASIHIEKAITLEPASMKMRILAGQIFWAMGDQTKAELHLKKAVELGPDEAEPLVNLAMAVTPKDPTRAIKLYNDYLFRHPNEADIQERLAQLYQAAGDFEKAKTTWGIVLDLDPESIRGHLASAQIAEVQHDTTTAISHYEAVLAQDASNLPLLLRIGELRYRHDEMKEAYDAFSKAQSIAPNSASANFWLALLAENRGEWDEAIRLLKSVADKAPEPGVLLRLSFYYSQVGQKKEAIALLKKLSADEPENTDFLNYLSVAYEHDNQFQKALETVGKLITIDPENAGYHFHKATLLDRLGQFAAAEAELKTCIQMDPEFHMAMNYLGYSYAEKKIKLNEAEKLVNDAIALDPENSAYLDSMGWIYYRQEKFKKAVDFLQQATVEGKDALIWEHLGDAQFAQGNFLAAIASWEMSLRINAKQSLVKKKLAQAVSKLTPAQTFTVYLNNSREDFLSLVSLNGLAKIQVCQKKPCLDIHAGFNYLQSGDLRVEVPGPMGVPLMLMVKSSSSSAEFGSVEPTFLEVENYVEKAFNRIDSLLRAKAFPSAGEFIDHVGTHGGELRASANDLTIAFDGKSGRLKEMIWGKPGVSDRLMVLDQVNNSILPVPSSLSWRDDAAGVTLKILLIKPVVKTSQNP